MLFYLIDNRMSPRAARLALGLLQQLPTAPTTPQRLVAALNAPTPADALRTALLSGGGGGGTPYQLLYTLQALTALLFPAAEEEDKDEEEEAAAGDGNAAAAPPGCGSAAALRQVFLLPGCVDVVLEAAADARACAEADPHLRRELSHLLVVLLHNVLDAASAPAATRQAQQLGRGARGSPTTGGDAMSVSGSGAMGTVVAPSAGGSMTASVSTTPIPASPSGGDATSEARAAATQPSPSAGSAAMEMEAAAGAAAAPAGSGGRAAGAASPLPGLQQQAPLLLEGRVCQLLAQRLLQLALDAGGLWAVAPPGGWPPSPSNSSEDAAVDVGVVKEALTLAVKLLEARPELQAPVLLAPDGAGAALVPQLLLHPHHGAVRDLAAEALCRLCVAGAADTPIPHLWLLRQLLVQRAAAAAAPGAACEQFYRLLCEVVASSPACEGGSGEEYRLLEALLAEEVAALAAPAQQQQQQGRGDALVAAAAPAWQDSDGEGEEPAGGSGGSGDASLKGRLELVLSLVRLLDRRCVGGASEGGLIALLLRRYLFPEAALRCAAAAGSLDLAAAGPALEPRCTSEGCRSAALALAADLMRGSASNLQEGVAGLLELHYAHPVLAGALNVAPGPPRRHPRRFCGLRNAGATCYMNSVFQQLFMQPRIRALVLGAAEVAAEELSDHVFGQLQVCGAVLVVCCGGGGAFRRLGGGWARLGHMLVARQGRGGGAP